MKDIDLLASGYVSMDRIVKIDSPARVGFTSLITNRTCTRANYGGCGLNIVQDLNCLGMTAVPVIRVGDDYDEIGFKKFLKDNQIPTDAVCRVSGEICPVCYMVEDPQGQHITLFHPGAMDEKYAAVLPDELFRRARIAVMTVASRKDNEEFLYRCKKNSLPLALSMKCDKDAFPRDFLEEVLLYSSLIFTNESEREAIEGWYGCPITDYMVKGSAKAVITTLGCMGSKCYTMEEGKLREVYTPVCSVGNYRVVDTSGTGDAFVAGFLYAWLKGGSISKCAMTGTVLSSFILEKEGCCTNAPCSEKLNERLGLLEQAMRKE